jgi:hypothetical protein
MTLEGVQALLLWTYQRMVKVKFKFLQNIYVTPPHSLKDSNASPNINRNQPKCNHFVYNYMQLVVIRD